MEWMDFVAALVDSLAWPVAVVVLLVVFKPVVLQLVTGGVRRWKAGPSGLEVEYWERETNEIKETIVQQLPAEPEDRFLTGGGLLTEELTDLAHVSPSAVVVEAFSRIEVELRQILTSNEISIDHKSTRQLALLANQQDLITSESVTAVEGLAALRNLAAHGRANERLDQDRAIEYLHLADAVLYALRNKA